MKKTRCYIFLEKKNVHPAVPKHATKTSHEKNENYNEEDKWKEPMELEKTGYWYIYIYRIGKVCCIATRSLKPKRVWSYTNLQLNISTEIIEKKNMYMHEILKSCLQRSCYSRFNAWETCLF